MWLTCHLPWPVTSRRIAPVAHRTYGGGRSGGLRLGSGRRRQREEAPVVDSFDVVTLGAPGAGTTMFLAAMFGQLQGGQPGNGPFLDITLAQARMLQRILAARSEEHTSELQSLRHLVCRLLLEKQVYAGAHSNRRSTMLSSQRYRPTPSWT